MKNIKNDFPKNMLVSLNFKRQKNMKYTNYAIVAALIASAVHATARNGSKKNLPKFASTMSKSAVDTSVLLVKFKIKKNQKKLIDAKNEIFLLEKSVRSAQKRFDQFELEIIPLSKEVDILKADYENAIKPYETIQADLAAAEKKIKLNEEKSENARKFIMKNMDLFEFSDPESLEYKKLESENAKLENEILEYEKENGNLHKTINDFTSGAMYWDSISKFESAAQNKNNFEEAVQKLDDKKKEKDYYEGILDKITKNYEVAQSDLKKLEAEALILNSSLVPQNWINQSHLSFVGMTVCLSVGVLSGGAYYFITKCKIDETDI